MSSLREVQRAFLHAILDGAADTATPVDSLTAVPNDPRLAVYRNTLRANFAAALRSTYPVILRLVGEDYFAQTARRFQALSPSRSGDLLHAGDGFPAFLATLHGADEYRYLGDVARFEGLFQSAMLSADHAPFDLQALRQIEPAAYDSLQFELHPSVRLFDSAFPVRAIWEANQPQIAAPPTIDLGVGRERILIQRSHGQPALLELDAGEFAFLSALAVHAGFADACAAAADVCAAAGQEFNAAAALQRCVLAGAIVGFDSPP